MAFASRHDLRRISTTCSGFLELVQVVPFDEACAEAYSRIRLDLRQKGRMSSEIDNLIAAVSLAKGATLVTRNVGHFQTIEGLRIEDWKE
jgi:predicted nucleic acid-binding protein